jgi:hypothetical protein
MGSRARLIPAVLAFAAIYFAPAAALAWKWRRIAGNA